MVARDEELGQGLRLALGSMGLGSVAALIPDPLVALRQD